MESIIEALLYRQHQVTTITHFQWKGPQPENYTEILIDPPLDFESLSKLLFKNQFSISNKHKCLKT